MYYDLIKNQYSAQHLAAYLADRIISNVNVVIVSSSPDKIVDELPRAWRDHWQKLISERDKESDVAYKGVLTEIITVLQRVAIDFAESASRQVIVAHPYLASMESWGGRQLLICCDELSTIACSQLLSSATESFRLVTLYDSTALTKGETWLRQQAAQPVSKCIAELRQLLNQMQRLCDKTGVNLEGLGTRDASNAEMLGRALEAMRTPKQREHFLHLQTQIAKLRMICGRLEANDQIDERQLYGLKIIAAYLSGNASKPFPRTAYNSDWQLFETPALPKC